MCNIESRIFYKGFTAMQHKNTFAVFEDFLKEINPSNILEIGTAEGGFILGIRDILDKIGLKNTKIRTFDIYENEKRNLLSNFNIQLYTENIFDINYNLIKPELIIPFIQQSGTTLIFCDGGNKAKEFNVLSEYLKIGDIIMAHDYIDTRDNYLNNFEGKIWSAHEIGEPDIAECCRVHNLNPFHQDIFEKIVWACRKKIK
jgi:cephalosporin hydroxylase